MSWSQSIQQCLCRWCGGFKDQASSGQTQPRRSFAGKGTRCVLSAPPKRQWQQASGTLLFLFFYPIWPKQCHFRLCRRIQDSKMAGPANSKENTELHDFFQQAMMEENDGKWRPFPGACSTYWLPFSDQVKHSFTLMT